MSSCYQQAWFVKNLGNFRIFSYRFYTALLLGLRYIWFPNAFTVFERNSRTPGWIFISNFRNKFYGGLGFHYQGIRNKGSVVACISFFYSFLLKCISATKGSLLLHKYLIPYLEGCIVVWNTEIKHDRDICLKKQILSPACWQYEFSYAIFQFHFVIILIQLLQRAVSLLTLPFLTHRDLVHCPASV